jgi:hypothetical protein
MTGPQTHYERWIFVKDDERDPFGDWAFHPDSLETTPHPDRIL